MKVTLNNKSGLVEIDTFGAELASFSDAEGVQYLWRGDKEHWSGRAPILFPIVGALRNKKTIINEKEYSMQQHGFAKRSEFRLVTKTDDTASFMLTSNDETRSQYPFDFNLLVTYRLNGCTLTNEFEVMNMGEEPMPFVIGGHPAFNCPILPNETFEDYVIEFEHEETANCPRVDMEASLIDFSQSRKILENEKSFSLKHSMFRGDALIFTQLKSRKVKLYSRLSGRGVEMDFNGFNYLGIWSAINNAPFVALEPWVGCATCYDEDDHFEKKRGMVMLAPNKSAKFSFDVTLL